jgi:hypothetical protein
MFTTVLCLYFGIYKFYPDPGRSAINTKKNWARDPDLNFLDA